MRIPFDLMAALIGLQAVQQLVAQAYPHDVPMPGEERYTAAAVAVLGYWLAVWLFHEALARRYLWATRFGHHPGGLPAPAGAPAPAHPLERHARGEALGQALAVLGYVLLIWRFDWTMLMLFWPEALGLDALFAQATLDKLARSELVGTTLNLVPFLGAMVLSWLPRRRMLQASLGRAIPRRRWLALEARMTFMPLCAWFAINLVYDALNLSGVVDLNAALNQTAQDSGGPAGTPMLVGGFLLILFSAVVLMPWMVLKLFRCRPMPEGELKDRMNAVVARSGVKVRAIMAWGPRGSGLANACVLGPWSRFRYVLISPGLTDMLTPEECEAVVAHELGHARHGHLYMLVAAVLFLAGLSALLARFMPFSHPLAQAAVFVALIVLYLRYFFGALMRMWEREADLASSEIVGSPLPLAHALEKLARCSGGIRDVYSWHHGSIASRVHALLEDGLDPERMARYHRRMNRLRAGFLAFASLTLFVVVALTALDDRAAAAQARTEHRK
ncbi:MAG: M48 family metalloprotease [Planctomycetota bacterium]|nr:M48 family metalloprotease [Planctomycetota bacterium]